MSPAIPEESLLDNLRALADELGHAPSLDDVDEYSDYSRDTYCNRFPTFTTALARIGTFPKSWYPLTDEEIHRFHTTARASPPRTALPALFFQFLPVPRSVYRDFESGWLRRLADEYVLRVPADHSPNPESVEMRIPSTWTDPHTDTERQTELPSLLNWWLTNHRSTPHDSISGIRQALSRVASETHTNLADERPTIRITNQGEVPRVTPGDLRHTHGLHLARNGASRKWIARRLGLDAPEKSEVYFQLLEHHDRYSDE